MNCPKCNNDSTMIAEDDRQEWREEEYECNKCGCRFTRKITYKTQSNMIDTDEIVDVNTGE
jgi:transposase-like protein